ncbi:MAG: hypothetical protein ACYSUF_09360 [Planctomycetota bacterium]|jgi:hypothetical protein
MATAATAWRVVTVTVSSEGVALSSRHTAATSSRLIVCTAIQPTHHAAAPTPMRPM